MIIDNQPALIISLEESHLSKPESPFVISYLKKTAGYRVAMITGDNEHSAVKVANHLGISRENVVHSAYPWTKRDTVIAYQKLGESVMFVGDGINDGPVLAQADIGVAINSASEITVGAADIVLMKDDLLDVVDAIRISQMSFRRIKINFVWAFLYNLILVPIAMGVFYPIDGFQLDPMFAGAAMALSSISVVCSSLMLKMYKPIPRDV